MNVKRIDAKLLSTAAAATIIGCGGLFLNVGVAQATDDGGALGPGVGCTNYYGGSGSPNTGTNPGGNGTGAGGVLGGAPGAIPQPTGPGGSAAGEIDGGSGCDVINPDGQGAGTSTP